MVKAQTSLDKVVVTADGDGVVSHAGGALLVGLADKVELTAALWWACRLRWPWCWR